MQRLGLTGKGSSLLFIAFVVLTFVYRLGANVNHLAAVAVTRLQGELAKDGREPLPSKGEKSFTGKAIEKSRGSWRFIISYLLSC